MVDLTSGTVVRGIRREGRKPFDAEVLDQDDRLQEASVNGIEGSDNIDAIRVGMQDDMFPGGYRTASVKKIIQKGGRVMKDPIDCNPNHCQIFGLKIKDANNLFS